MPGLLDAHVPLALIDLDAAAEAALPPAVLALRIKDVIEATLDAGFTTVRDAGGLDWGFQEAGRPRLIPGPRIFISCGFEVLLSATYDQPSSFKRSPFPAYA